MSDSTSESLRKKFTPEEDIQLKELVKIHGAKKWIEIAKSMPGRTGRQCRDRFQNYLSPCLTNGPWNKEDDLLLLQKVQVFGSTWSKIIQYFPGRSPNNVKNRYNIHLARFQSDIEKFKEQNGFCSDKKLNSNISNQNDFSVWDFFKPEEEISSPESYISTDQFFSAFAESF